MFLSSKYKNTKYFFHLNRLRIVVPVPTTILRGPIIGPVIPNPLQASRRPPLLTFPPILHHNSILS